MPSELAAVMTPPIEPYVATGRRATRRLLLVAWVLLYQMLLARAQQADEDNGSTAAEWNMQELPADEGYRGPRWQPADGVQTLYRGVEPAGTRAAGQRGKRSASKRSGTASNGDGEESKRTAGFAAGELPHAPHPEMLELQKCAPPRDRALPATANPDATCRACCCLLPREHRRGVRPRRRARLSSGRAGGG